MSLYEQGELSIIRERPPAGQQFEFVVPDDEQWEVLGLFVVLQASAAVGNRGVGLRITIQGQILLEVDNPTTQTAGQLQRYNYWNQLARIVASNFRTHHPMPMNLILSPRDKIESILPSTAHILDVADFFEANLYIRKRRIVLEGMSEREA